MDEGLSGISAGASVDIKRTDGEYLSYVAHIWKSECISLFLWFCVGVGVVHSLK
jgi:hypothetical protein